MTVDDLEGSGNLPNGERKYRIVLIQQIFVGILLYSLCVQNVPYICCSCRDLKNSKIT
jgi:hypothetical protein